MSRIYRAISQPEPNDTFFGLPYEFLRLSHGEEVDTLKGMLDSAVEWGEQWSDAVFRETQFTGQFPCFQEDLTNLGTSVQFIEIDIRPLISVEAVRVLEDGNDTPTSVTGFRVVHGPVYGRVFLAKGADKIYPDLSDPAVPPIEIDFTAGYSKDFQAFPRLQIPSSVRNGLKQHVAYLYENRADVKGDYDDAIPDEVKRSYQNIRVPRLGSSNAYTRY